MLKFWYAPIQAVQCEQKPMNRRGSNGTPESEKSRSFGAMNAKPALKAVIFDMDGTLFDSEPLWQIAEFEVFSTVGVTLTTEMMHSTIGLRIDEVIAYWFTQFPWTGKVASADSRRNCGSRDRACTRTRELAPGCGGCARAGAGVRFAHCTCVGIADAHDRTIGESFRDRGCLRNPALGGR
jgi:hypothetical protein